MTARMRRREAFGTTVLLLTAPQLAFGAGIVAVRLWPARDYTRVTIESDTPLAATHTLVDSPPRLVVDIDALALDAALRQLVGKVRPDDPYIFGVRVGQYQPRVVRLVFDLKQTVRPEQFTLAPVPPYQHRLVFDLYPLQEADPLLALVRDKEAAEQRAAQAVQDALGELIARIDPQPPLATLPPALPVAPPASAPVLQTPAPRPPPTPVTPEERRKVDRLIIVAIDAGHGGEDPGAIGPTGLREKDVVLAISLALRDRLNAVPGLRVMLTRDGDFFVPLAERVRKARRVQADLFVSIHADAFVRREARGASVFVLSERGATSSAARWMSATACAWAPRCCSASAASAGCTSARSSRPASRCCARPTSRASWWRRPSSRTPRRSSACATPRSARSWWRRWPTASSATSPAIHRWHGGGCSRRTTRRAAAAPARSPARSAPPPPSRCRAPSRPAARRR